MAVVIFDAFEADFPIIQEIAYKTWPIAYAEILSKEQLDYMLGAFYSIATLTKNRVEKSHHFILAKEDNAVLGFSSFEHQYDGKKATHIHKIYILPQAQGKGVGKILIQEVEKRAKENHASSVTLNVNRFNVAQEFYKKIGFEIVKEIDIQLDHGYLMEDYVMLKPI